MSAKELGQIHTVNDVSIHTAAQIPPYIARRIDLAGGLSDKLQRMVRQGNFFKLTGIDMSLQSSGDTATMSGYIRYYSPTKGRCAAFRHAFKAMADQMMNQGIPMRTNAQYDFRVELTDQAVNPITKNLATLDGTNGLALNNVGTPGASVFGVYNKSVLPTLDNTPDTQLFDEGFDTLLQSGGSKTDFVLNDTPLFTGNEHTADLSYERIPFQLAIDSNGGDTVTSTFQFRPDPALYIAVLTGNMEIVIEDTTISDQGAATLECAYYVSGWKSIMGDPDKKKNRRVRRSSNKKA